MNARVGRRVVGMILAVALGAMLVVVPAASADVKAQATTPKILSSDFTNPIAYEQQSLQSTRFKASVDMPGCDYMLFVQSESGLLRSIAQGPVVGTATEISWDGKIDGRRLTSGVHEWMFVVTTKDGQLSVARGKVIVSKICVSFRDWANYGLRKHPVYMVAGPVNMYVTARITAHPGVVEIAVDGSKSRYVQAGTTKTIYLRDAESVRTRGLRDVRYRTVDQDTYTDTSVTIVQ